MFGDTELIGTFDKSFDSKGRIVIPSVMNPEEGDKLGIAYGADYEHLLLMTLKSFRELYKRLETANNKEILDQDPKLVEQMRRLIGIVEVDSQRRIQVPKYALQRTGLGGNIIMVGQMTCLGVYKK